jgi:dephospho-CoA kinase
MRLVVCLSGRIGSGKTSISAAICETLHWPVVSFGNYVRHVVAERGGDPTQRAQLQEVGQQLVLSDPDKFVADTLRFHSYNDGANLIVDGLRHLSIYAAVGRAVSPAEVRLLHLDVDQHERFQRILRRSDVQYDPSIADQHVVESEVISALPDQADFIIDGSQAFEDVVKSCLREIRGWVAV